MRGRVARIQINNVANIIVLMINCISIINEAKPVKIAAVNNLMKRMFAYSAMKINANMPALYSTLNPDTSSDSPSAKSNGVRFVSARFVINHITNNGVIISINHEIGFIMFRSIDLCRISTDNKISAIDTSYEIV
jgi:hypothetical protein